MPGKTLARRILVAAAATIAFVAAPARAEKKTWYTYPQPPKLKPYDPMTIYPAFEIPEHPERYVWKITGKLRGKQVYSQAVPAYKLDAFGGGLSKVGTVPIDTEIKLEYVYLVGHTHFYALAYPDEKSLVYVSGLYIEPVRYTPPVQ